MGIFAAIGAFISWACGDFLIQKATRKIGDWGTIFFIGVAGFIMLTPFVYRELPAIFSDTKTLTFLALVALCGLISTLLLFESLKRGKISIVEPTFSFELPITVLLSALIWHEILLPRTYFLIGIIFIGLLLVIVKHHSQLHFRKNILERGVLFGFSSALLTGIFNFVVGISSQSISPLMTIWFVHTFMGVSALIFLVAKGQLVDTWIGFRHNKRLITLDSVLDNLGWILFAVATTLIPISIATTISESYIALAVGLGIFVNKDKIQKHQIIGILIVIAGIILLSMV